VAGRTPKEAADNFIDFFKESLSCLSSQIVHAYQQSQHLYKIYYDPYAEVSAINDRNYYVSITQIFRAIPDPEDAKQYKARTQEYSYRLLETREEDEILAYHWHPNDPGVKYPHLHIHEVRRIHFPTSRVCLEDFIGLLFRDYDVKPNLSHAECKRILTKNKKSFEKWATWKVQHP